ncbi:GTPase activity, partial [Pristimantis euphronides]
MADFIKVKSKDNDEDEVDYDRHFPIFIWAVRDVTLKLEFNRKPITEDEYLGKALMLQKVENVQKSLESVERHNRYRDCIRMYFKERKCFMFDLPTGNTDILQNMDTVSEDQLKSQFVAQTKNFCDYVYKTADVKYVDDARAVNGQTLARLATLYAEAISSSSAACMEDVVTNISVAENTAAVREATQHYESLMNERITYPTETLDQIIALSAECEREALSIFMKRSFKDTDRRFNKQFLETIKQKRDEFFQKNDMESCQHCQKLIKALSKELQKCLDQGSYVIQGGYQKFKEELERIEEKYKNEPRKGKKAEEVLQNFKESKKTYGVAIMMSDKALSDQQKKIEEEIAKQENLKLQRKMEEGQQSEENKKVEHQKRMFLENLKEAFEIEKNRTRLLQEQLQSVMQHKMGERDLYRAQGYEEHAGMYEEQMNDVRTRQKEVKSGNWLNVLKDGFCAVGRYLLPQAISLGSRLVSAAVQAFQ